MKSIVTALTVLLFVCGVTYGQETEPGPGFEHLKCYGPFLGTWQYEGPLLEDVPDFAEKGSDVVFEIAYRRILNKSAVEYNWSVEFANGSELGGKALIGWDANEKKIVFGGMNANGGMGLGTVTPDKAANSLTLTTEGVDGEGEKKSGKYVITKTGKDTFTWQALERTGGLIEGPSPVCTLTRVERKKKEAK